MAAPFDLNDDSVVVIIGSGAGGGTLGNELAQKGVDVVILEAGGRARISRISSTTNGTASPSSPGPTSARRRATGGWRRISPTCRPGSSRRSAARPRTGPAPRCASRSTSSRPHELRRRARAPTCWTGRSRSPRWSPTTPRPRTKMGVTAHQRHPAACPATTTSRCSKAGANKLGYKECHTGPWRSTPAARRPQLLPADRLLLPGLQVGRQMVDALHRDPEGRGDRQARSPAERQASRSSTTPRGKVTGVVYADKDGKLQQQKARIVAVAGNSIESPRLLLNSASTKFPDGLANSSGQVGKNYMRHTTGSVYAIFDKPVHMYRGTTMAGIIRDEARHDPSRGFVGGYELETLSLGLPFMAAFLDPGAWGRDFTSALDHYDHMAGMWIVGEDMPQEKNRVTLHPDAEGQVRHADRRRPFRRPPQRHRHAQPRLRAGRRRSTRRSARRAPSRRRPIPRPTISAPTG